MHLMAQPVVMHGFISDPLASGLGFLPRCLICEPKSSIGQRLSVNTRRDDTALDNFAWRLKSVLSQTMPTWDDGRTLKPKRLALTPSARELLVSFSDIMEEAQQGIDEGPNREQANSIVQDAIASEDSARARGLTVPQPSTSMGQNDLNG